MSYLIDRVNKLEVYNQLLKNPYMTVNELAKRLNKSCGDIESYIISLRQMYEDGEITKYVYSSKDGYYLGEVINNENQIDGYDLKSNNYNAINLNNSTDEKFEENSKNQISSNDINNTLVLDFKKQFNKDIKLLKINIIDDEDTTSFSLTISLMQDETII